MRYALILSLIFIKIVLPQEAPVPMEIQYTLLLKIITFDKEFHNKFNNKMVIGIVYQENFKNSVNQKNELIKIIKEKNFLVDGKKVEYELLDISGGNVYDMITRSNADILYVLPLKSINIQDITGITKKERMLTFTGIPEYIKNGIAVGIGIKEGKPSIIINLRASKEEGTEFTSQLLKLSEVINN